jgi:hypothetical protein
MPFEKCLFAVLIAFIACSYASASDLEQFKNLQNQYYYFDNQDFNKFTCQVESPETNVALQVLSENYKKSTGDKISVKEIYPFLLKYSKEDGLDFTRPIYDIDIGENSESGGVSKTKIEISFMLNNIADSIIQMLFGVFNEFRMPDASKYEDLKISYGHEGTIVVYNKNDEIITELHKIDSALVKRVDSGNEIFLEYKYIESSDNKKLISQISINSNNSGYDSKINTRIEYQNIKNISIPKNVQIFFDKRFKTLKESGELEINLNNCKVE